MTSIIDSTPTAHAEAGDCGRSSLAHGSAPCSCWETMDNQLREKGFKIADACSALVIVENRLKARRYLPLQRADGKKPSRADPKGIAISHCPFCGQSLLPNNVI